MLLPLHASQLFGAINAHVLGDGGKPEWVFWTGLVVPWSHGGCGASVGWN